MTALDFTPNMEVTIGRLKLRNPIMPASGTFGEEMEELFDLHRLGAIVPKSITKHPRPGNAVPRVCETAAGMMNSIGIQSKGIHHYMQRILPFYAQYDVPLIASISADSIDEFAELAECIGGQPSVSALELNISCPNLKGDGEAFGLSSEATRSLVSKVRSVTDKTVIVKLSPNVTRIQEIALAAEEAGADALNAANTLLALSIDIHTRKSRIGNGMGGLSGPAVKPIIVRLIYQIKQVCRLPVIGCGGVMSGADAIELILAGASAVQVGTASFVNPLALIEILDEIEQYMKDYNVRSMIDIIGKAHV